MSFYLVTTSNKYENYTPKLKQLLLGKWCLNYKDNRDINCKILNYHWNDRKKLHADFLKINDLYEDVLCDLSIFLNDYHNLKYSKKYWRIVVGLWLNYFIEIIFDRYEMLNIASNITEEIFVNNYRYYKPSYIANNMSQFMDFVQTDNWNEYIYSEIINKRFCEKINLIFINKKKINNKKETEIKKISNKKKLSNVLKHFLFLKQNKYFFKDTYLSNNNLLKIFLKLKHFNHEKRLNFKAKNEIDLNSRNLFFKKYSNNKKDFYSLVIELVSENIPIIYLEDFKKLHDLVKKKYNENIFKSIFTSNAYAHDDIFKITTAYNVEKGSKLIIGQHGGNDGTCKLSSIENHQIKIADIFLSWGWKKKNHSNIFPIGNFLCNGKKISYNKNGYGLVVSTQVPKYSYRLFSMPLSSQWLDYFEEQKKFYNNLSSNIQDKLIFRINNIDYGWNEAERLKEISSNIKINKKSSLEKLLKHSRIHIATYNGTVFLETLYYNFPTIIFWNSDLFELNDEAIKYFNILKSAGIFFDNPLKAAEKLCSVWDNIDEWWNNKDLQNKKNQFCKKYNFINNNLIDQMVKKLKN